MPETSPSVLTRVQLPLPVLVAVRAALAGVVVSVVLLGHVTETQPHFRILMAASVLVYLLARGEELVAALLQYLTSTTTVWRWLFTAWAVLSLLWTTRGGFSVDRAITVIEIQVVGLVFFDAARNVGQARWILSSVFVCAVFAAVHAMASAPSAFSGRMLGVYRDPNTLGTHAVVGLAIFCARIGDARRHAALVMHYIAALILLVGVLASASLKGIVGGIFVVTAGLFLRRTRARIAAFVVIAGSLGAVVVGTLESLRMFWELSIHRASMTLFSLGSAADVSLSFLKRIRFVREGVALIAEAPLAGRGLGTFRWLSDEGTYAHNNFVEIGVSLGIVGVVLYYGFHFSLLATSVRDRHRGRLVGRSTIIVVLTFLLLDMAAVSYTDKLSTLLMITLAGWLERSNE